MPAHKLLLHPKDAGFRIPADRLAEVLQGIELIDSPRPVGGRVFYPTGAQFLQLVTFLGCSPSIELDPPENPDELEQASNHGRFCHIFLDSDERPRFRHDPRMRAPLCPHCRTPLPDWPALCATAQDNPALANWTCHNCGLHGSLGQLQLRKNAALASCWIEIRGVYPAEAVPGTRLLETLQALGNEPWRVVYLQE